MQTEKPRPLSFFARFQRPIPIGKAVTLALHAERCGRSVDTLAAVLLDGDRELARFSAAFGREAEGPLRGQGVPAMTPLRQPTPIWRFLEEVGIEPAPLMRRVGYRGEPLEAGLPDVDGPDWHLRNQWPATASDDLAIRAAVALMIVDPAGVPVPEHRDRVPDDELPVHVLEVEETGPLKLRGGGHQLRTLLVVDEHVNVPISERTRHVSECGECILPPLDEIRGCV